MKKAKGRTKRPIKYPPFYVLPNNVIIQPGSRVRISVEVLEAIPLGDFELLGLDIEDGSQSPGSEILLWPT